MPYLTTGDSVRLYYEEIGSGMPIVFVHEFAGDLRSYEPQLRYFARRYRCIAYNARGYPPSDVPPDVESYSQDQARDDLLAVLDELNIEKAHIVGLSMGGFAALHLGIEYPERARSLVIGGSGYGATPDTRKQFAEETEATARLFETDIKQAAEIYAAGPTRVRHQNKDPRGWREFLQQLASHSGQGSAQTLRGVLKRRPSLYDLVDEMRSITAPTLILTGDEDWPCLEPALLMKRAIPTSALLVLPNSGHAINLEEPAAFNRHLADFFSAVDVDAWPTRDPRALAASILGIGTNT